MIHNLFTDPDERLALELAEPGAFVRCVSCPTMIPSTASDVDGKHLGGPAGLMCVECSADAMEERERAMSDRLAAQRDYEAAMEDRDRFGGMGPS